jgi:hypothetical protein
MLQHSLKLKKHKTKRKKTYAAAFLGVGTAFVACSVEPLCVEG